MSGATLIKADPPGKGPKASGDYRLILALSGVVVLALMFWLGSRYPALNEKAMMGGDTPLSGLAFDIVFDIFPDNSLWWQFVANTVNWVKTNLKGMSFGVLFGAAAITLLSLIRRRSFKNGFANAALGALIGAPLGVCVNCAAPIALGLHMGRMRLETTLSALLASPTLNVIVVTMSFSLLPLHVALTKLVLAIVMVLLVMPLLCQFILVRETEQTRDNFANIAPLSEAKGFSAWIGRSLAPRDNETPPSSLFGSALWFVKTFGRNLFFIAVITVPMMFLAAVLAALISIFFDSSTLGALLPRGGPYMIVATMIVIAVIASMVPAPIALDVILTIVLMGLGMSSFYGAVMIIALGSFSFYAFLILWKAISLRTALTVWAATIGVSVLGGIIAFKTFRYEFRFQSQRIDQFLASRGPAELPVPPALSPAMDWNELRAKIDAQRTERTALVFETAAENRHALDISRSETVPRNLSPESTNSPRFSRLAVPDFGLEDQGINSPLNELGPSIMLGGIGSGDIHNDGWVDVVYRRPLGAPGLSLYANIGGQFVRQTLDLGRVDELDVANTAFVDLDNDDALDLIVTTQYDGLFIFYNDGGTFSQQNSLHIAEPELNTVIALSFSDLNGDGFADMVLGGWVTRQGGEGWAHITPELYANRVLWSEEGRSFSAEIMPSSLGPTLSGLITDINRDGQPDYLKGDDLAGTDQFVLFGEGGAMRSDLELQPFPYFTLTTMSYDEGDWNNDLVPDYYGGQISEKRTSGSRDGIRGDGKIYRLCERYGQDLGWTTETVRQCAAEMLSVDLIRSVRTGSTFNLCRSDIMTERDTTYCAIVHRLGTSRNLEFFKGNISAEKAIKDCRNDLANWPHLFRLCDTYGVKTVPKLSKKELLKTHRPPLGNGNILMTAQADGSFKDMAPTQGVNYPGWTWNSRFTDLDQDGWLDLMVMTGSRFATSRATSNHFYRNEGGAFSDQTEAYGLSDLSMTYSSANFDFDRDGDIDIIRPPDTFLPVIHRNEQPAGAALWVNLRDEVGNRMGLDARVSLCTDGETIIRPGQCQTRPINASGGFMSYDPIAAHFGLGAAQSVSVIEVVWRDGEVSTIYPQDLNGGEITITRKRGQDSDE